ncbi:hypothetical protein DMENIID0001_109210 [Sergentomyia squamirostris]
MSNNSDYQRVLERMEKLEERIRRYKTKYKRHGRSQDRCSSERSVYSRYRSRSRAEYRSRSRIRDREESTSTRSTTRERSAEMTRARDCSPTLAEPGRPSDAIQGQQVAENVQNPDPNMTDTVPVEKVLSGSPDENEKIFGEKLYQEESWSADINAELAVRLEEIVMKGIPDDFLKDLIKKYPLPKNCQRFAAPRLNEVIKAVMPESLTVRDDKIIKRQSKIAAALSGMSQVIMRLVTEKSTSDWKNLKDNLLDAAKILADLHHDESNIRRNLVLANVEKNMVETLNSTTIGEYLFGDRLEDNVKSAKALESTGKELKRTMKPKNSKIPSRSHQESNPKAGGTRKFSKWVKKSPQTSPRPSPRRLRRRQSPSRIKSSRHRR